ncbi:MAG: MFS transporter [Candidatus Eisenbacteria bacterium]|nr:MFS transporter [Candidatus Eisenbacteria bacterium]
MSDRRAIRSWCLYDWANSAFATTIMAALFPPFFRSLATRAGMASADATATWGYTTSAALVLVALSAPILGAVADVSGSRKRLVGLFAGLGILATALFATLGSEAWLPAAFLFIAGNIGFAGGNVFYESLLPHITTPETIDDVSARGFALGYLGGGILLVLNLLWVMFPDRFGMPGESFAIRASFISVAVWWGAFSVPFFRDVPEPRLEGIRLPRGGVLPEAWGRLRTTFSELSNYRHLFVFLIAFWIYSDGIGTIVRMATAYGDEIGIGLNDMIGALVLTQFVGVPCSLLFGRVASKTGPKPAVLVGLTVYAVISVAAYFMSTAAHFYALAIGVGVVQGGTQAVSRSLFGSMVPRHKAAEFFGFFSTSSKFAGIAGPFIFGLVGQLAGTSRMGIVSVAAFFIVGALLLGRVDVDAGRAAARRAEEAAAS